MIALFLIYAIPDVVHMTHLRQGLPLHGYTLRERIHGPNAVVGGTTQSWQDDLRSSQAIVLLWSANAAQSEYVTQQLDYAQWLYKRVITVLLDTTPLPEVLASANVIRDITNHADIIPRLIPHLPSTTQNDVLNGLLSQPQEPRKPTASQQQQNATPHLFGVSCSKGHITYYDKRYVCRRANTIVRGDQGTKLDTLALSCDTVGCGERIIVEVDCEGYR